MAAAIACLLLLFAPALSAEVRVDDTVLGYVSHKPQFATTVRLLYVTGYTHTRQAAATTVFAPTEGAWDRSGYRSLLSYQSPTSNDAPNASAVVGLLRGLAIDGSYPPDQLAAERVLKNLAGQELTIGPGGKTVRWRGRNGVERTASLIGDPVVCSNGMIYPVDAVIGQ